MPLRSTALKTGIKDRMAAPLSLNTPLPFTRSSIAFFSIALGQMSANREKNCRVISVSVTGSE